VVDFPAFTVREDGATAIEKSETTWLSADEVLPAKFASPPYTAVIECEPAVSAVVVNVACALPLRAPVPSVVAPSMNVTVPLGVPEPLGVTVAVSITDWPKTDGLTEDTTEVVVEALFTT